MTTIIVKPRNKKEFSELKNILKSMNAVFELNETLGEFSPEFERMVEEGKKEIREGKGTKITIEEMTKSWK